MCDIAADSDIISMLHDVMNIAIEKQIYSTTVTNGVMTMLPKKENWGARSAPWRY
jgi:hypothetical protein